jgi:formimidoylglutamate deiminase
VSRVARERGERIASSTRDRPLWAPRAWLPEGWADHVLLHVRPDGRWERVEAGVHVAPPDAIRLEGPVLPGLVDAHSHAFQRAFAGLAERRVEGAGRDDFWSWRERMYAVAGRIAPDTLRAIAAQLDVELLKGGYTHVCEFHYLQHDADGRPYADPLALAWALADAAAEAGIGLTVLPVLYERGGFDGAPLAPRQRRFALDADATWAACGRIAAARRPRVHAGLAIHSLRAAAPDSIERLLQNAEGYRGPIHVHVAEQAREVEESVAALGARPVEWLASRRRAPLDARWQLVHATHVTRAEIEAVAAARAGVVLCPSTEANLGDGLTDLRGWLDANDGATALSIGSDSHVTRSWTEELRLLEYGQRLVHRERNVAAGGPGTDDVQAPAGRLWQRALSGGASAAFGAGVAWGLVAGARADLLVADLREPALLGVPPESTLDALVFSSPSAPWRGVMVAGRWVVRDRHHEREAAIASRFESAMRELRAR